MFIVLIVHFLLVCQSAIGEGVDIVVGTPLGVESFVEEKCVWHCDSLR